MEKEGKKEGQQQPFAKDPLCQAWGRHACLWLTHEVQLPVSVFRLGMRMPERLSTSPKITQVFLLPLSFFFFFTEIWFMYHKTHLVKYTTVHFSIFPRCVQSSPPSKFHRPKKTPIPFSSQYSSRSRQARPWQPLTYFLSPWSCLFWTFDINGVIHYVAFPLSGWLLSLSRMFSRSIRVVACLSTSSPFMWE